MNTTALRIEILTVGIQTGVILAYLFHVELLVLWKESSATTIEHMITPSTFVVLALCYSLGAAMDGFTAIIDGRMPFYRIEAREKDEEPWSKIDGTWIKDAPSTARLRLENPGARDRVIGSEFDQRLLRSTGFNLFLAAGVAAWFCPWYAFMVAAVAGCIVCWAWWRRRQRVNARLYKLVEEISKVPEPEGSR